MKLRTVSRLSVIVLVVVVAAIMAIHSRFEGGAANAAGQSAGQPPNLVAGTMLNGTRAPAFQLTDQNGATVSLAQFKGHPIVLTFIDATCTTECPVTAQYLDSTAQYLGTKATKDTVWLALTVNPDNTVANADGFIKKNNVTVPLHFLLGTHAQLAPLWSAYHIYVQPSPSGDVQHTIVTYLIDKHGHEQEVLDQSYDPKAAAKDIQALLSWQG